MKIIDEWKHVLLKAWSVRLMLISGLFDILERTLPYLDQSMFPPGVLGWFSIATLFGAGIARFIQQQEIHHAPDPADPDEK